MLLAPLLIIVKKWKQLNCPPVHEYILKMWYINKIEYFLAININYWYMLQNKQTWKIMLSEKANHKRPYIYYIIPFLGNVQNKQLHRMKSILVVP